MSNKKSATSTKAHDAVQSAPVKPPVPSSKAKKWPVAPSREGKRSVTVFINEDAFDQLQRLSLDEKRPVLSLMREAIDALFRSKNLPAKAVEE
jgi:hypothetical protein